MSIETDLSLHQNQDLVTFKLKLQISISTTLSWMLQFNRTVCVGYAFKISKNKLKNYLQMNLTFNFLGLLLKIASFYIPFTG